MKSRSVIFIVLVVISMIISSCFFSKSNKRYPDVTIGERFNSIGFDGYCIKLPDDYMIEIDFAEGNTAYKISNYDDVMQNTVKIIEENIEYYFCVESVVFFKCANKNGEETFFSLDTSGNIGSNLTVYVNEAQLLNDNAIDKIDWVEVRPND